jgi:hypothetical protein
VWKVKTNGKRSTCRMRSARLAARNTTYLISRTPLAASILTHTWMEPKKKNINGAAIYVERMESKFIHSKN